MEKLQFLIDIENDQKSDILRGVENINSVLKERGKEVLADIENRRLTLGRDGKQPLYLGHFRNYEGMRHFVSGMATVIEDLEL